VNFKRRILTGVAAGAFMATLVAAPALADASSCDLIEDFNTVVGTANSTPSISQSRSGAKATIDPPTPAEGFKECYGNDILDRIGPSVYVSIQPRGATSGLREGNGSAVQGLYLGVILCDSYQPPVSFCAALGSHTPHYIKAVNACSVTTITDLGVANFSPHTYAIYLDTAQQWHFNIDGGDVAGGTVANSSLCWGGGLREAGFGGAKWDRHDSYGNNSIDRVTLYNAFYGVFNQGWQASPFDPLIDCAWEDDTNDECVVSSSNSLRYWSHP
jgi:hypothetical protein